MHRALVAALLIGSAAPLAARAQAPLAGPAPASAAAMANPESEVRSAMQGFMDALDALDADRMSAYFADDVTAFVPLAKADYVDGKAELTQVFRNFCNAVRPKLSRLNLVPEDERVQVSGDLAVVTFQIREPNVTRRRTFTFRRVGGRWLISHMHASDLAPPRPVG